MASNGQFSFISLRLMNLNFCRGNSTQYSSSPVTSETSETIILYFLIEIIFLPLRNYGNKLNNYTKFSLDHQLHLYFPQWQMVKPAGCVVGIWYGSQGTSTNAMAIFLLLRSMKWRCFSSNLSTSSSTLHHFLDLFFLQL